MCNTFKKSKAPIVKNISCLLTPIPFIPDCNHAFQNINADNKQQTRCRSRRRGYAPCWSGPLFPECSQAFLIIETTHREEDKLLVDEALVGNRLDVVVRVRSCLESPQPVLPVLNCKRVRYPRAYLHIGVDVYDSSLLASSAVAMKPSPSYDKNKSVPDTHIPYQYLPRGKKGHTHTKHTLSSNHDCTWFVTTG